MSNLELSAERRSSISIVQLKGSLDVDTSPKMKKFLLTELKNGASIIICNMEHVNYIASIAVGVLIAINKDLEHKGGQLRLSAVNHKIERIFELLGFKNLFTIYDNDSKSLEGAPH